MGLQCGLSRTDLRRKAKELARHPPFKDKKRDFELQEKHWKQFNERFGVLCLTWNNASNFMWNDYAKNYCGFCVGYHSKILFQECRESGLGGGLVHYEDTLPIIMPSDPIEEKFTKQVFFKLKNFYYEQEYRIVKMWEPPVSEEVRKVKISAKAFTEIIIGDQVKTDDKQELISQAKKVNPEINIKIARHNINGVDIENVA